MPYHENFGITKTEYEEMKVEMNNIKVQSSGKEMVKINIVDSLITFDSQNKLFLLNSVKIDLQNNVAWIGDDKISFAKVISITNDKNAFNSAWNGYTWSSPEPNIVDLDSLNLILNKITIGKLDISKKTFMMIKCKHLKDGILLMNYDISILFGVIICLLINTKRIANLFNISRAEYLYN